MRRHAVDLAVLFALVSVLGAGAAAALPGDRGIVLHVWVLAVGALLLVAIVAEVGASVPRLRRSELTRALDAPHPAPGPVAELARVEREVTLAVGNAYDLHVRLLPRLREIAEARLERRGRRPGPDTLGRWWELLRPDRPEPADRFAPGIPADELRALVDDLARM